jgi:distribution and morphology protein 10
VLYNPLIGFLSTAYAAQVSPTVSLATRFGVNVYSYESDFALGGEWWIGRRLGRRGPVVEMTAADKLIAEKRKRLGGVLREPEPELEVEHDIHEVQKQETIRSLARARLRPDEDDHERDGVLKARISGNWSLVLLYESRIRNCLVSVGLISDILSGNSGKAIRSVGLEVHYYS